MSKTVFISYAHADGTQFAETLENWLESNEVNLIAFRDKADIKPGDEWKKVIDTAIEECFVMLVVVTQVAIHSIYVTYEWAYALGKNKRVIPLIVDSTVTDDNLHPKMKDLQYMPFASPTSADWEKLKWQLNALQAQDDIPQSVINAVAGLNSHNPDERLQAMESLKSIKHPSVVRELKRAIQHEYADVRAKAGIAFAVATDCTDSNAVPGLKEALHRSNSSDFDEAVSLLARIHNDVAAECLFSSFSGVYSTYKQNRLITALCRFEDPCVVPYLQKLWIENYSGQALERLAIFKDTTVFSDLVKHMRSQSGNEKLKFLELVVGYGDHPGIIEPLFNVLLEHGEGRGGRDERYFDTALQALENIGDEEILERLERAIAEGRFSSYKAQVQGVVDRIKQKLNSS